MHFQPTSFFFVVSQKLTEDDAASTVMSVSSFTTLLLSLGKILQNMLYARHPVGGSDDVTRKRQRSSQFAWLFMLVSWAENTSCRRFGHVG